MAKVYKCDNVDGRNRRCGATSERSINLSFYECLDNKHICCGPCLKRRYSNPEWSDNWLANIAKGAWSLMTSESRCPICWDEESDFKTMRMAR